MTRPLRNNKGFTLMELLVTIAVLSILLVAIGMFVVPTITMFAKTRNIAEAKSIGNVIMDYIEGSIYSTDVLELRDYTTTPSTISDSTYDADDAKTFYVLSSNIARNGQLELYVEGESARSDAISQGITAGYITEISFSKKKPETKVLQVEIAVRREGSSENLFTLTKDIYLPNMLADSATISGTESTPHKEILFYRPDGSEFITPP